MSDQDDNTPDPRRPSPYLGDPVFDALNEATRILDESLFSRAQVLQVAGLTSAQLKNTLDRNLVRLASGHNPGKGNARMFTGGDVLKIVTAHKMSAIGFPLKWSYLVADTIERRAQARLVGLDTTPGLVFATYPMKNGDWARVSLWEGMTEQPQLPPVIQVIEVDRIIDEVLAKLRAVEAGEPVPSFDVPEPEPEPNPYSPEGNAFGHWLKDEQGRNIRVGLTFEETEEFNRLEELDWADRTQRGDVRKMLITDEQSNRLSELMRRHESARLQRVQDEAPARQEAFLKSLQEKYGSGDQ